MRTLVDKYVIYANKGKLFCCLVDFQKAFDSIWHEGLFLKLLNNQIDGSFIALFQACTLNQNVLYDMVTKEPISLNLIEALDKDALFPPYYSIYI